MSQYKKVYRENDNLNYLLYLPKDYSDNKEWPLILFLHGMGERGDNLNLVKKEGLPRLLETNKEFPFVVVAPQCPDESYWTKHVDDLYQLINTIKKEHSIAESHVYLTGISMGGFGTWSLGTKYPEEFAAIAPICGGLEDREIVKNLKNTPVWVFHGAKDPIIPIESSQILVDTLKECGGDVQFTIYPDLEHDSWTVTYDNPELYSWFLKHKLRK
ncbi:carboxylesterase family protein [Anaeromicrobium sediminis]|uniref:Phospholipase n=1 Tax=Anaeromicrobium sediminis TaxID=1478221 RepID=A0A267MPK5_9FIRM|nr:alpha/beta hydrolase [Anaeromicrobium sediminis]PAB60828.1 phospholipase [Anaeromicrobium sediminis]